MNQGSADSPVRMVMDFLIHALKMKDFEPEKSDSA